MRRLFLAVDLSPDARQSLARALLWMGDYEGRVKIVPAENYHVTLKFLGATDEARIPLIRSTLESAIQCHCISELKINGWGVFPEAGHPKVFWAGVEPKGAFDPLFQQCETALEPLNYPREAIEFQSHVTLARAGKSRVPAGFIERWRLMGPMPEPASFSTRQITLYESVTHDQAPIYKPLAFIQLK